MPSIRTGAGFAITNVRNMVTPGTRYNRGVRFALLLAATLAIAGCSGANQDRQAVHQGILDHLAEAGFSNQNMDINETSIQFNGDKADALVEIAPKGANKAQGMQMHYSLQRTGSQWKVVGRSDTGAGHGAVAPGTNPHGGAMPAGAMPEPPGGGHKMPSPDDLPPSGKKK
jgi:hypothetical protein